MQQRYAALDFFAGSGLATQGLSSHFDVAWANDFCARKASVYLANHEATQTSANAALKGGKKHFALGSVEDVNGKKLPSATLAWASFPCQDLSLAGNMTGFSGKRSSLVWEWLRVMDEMAEMPPLLVAENVSGLLSANGGEYYRQLHRALTGRGYRVGPLVLDAALWVPQSRPRVFIVAAHKDMDISGLHNGIKEWCHSNAAVNACKGLNDVTWWSLPKPPARESVLSDIIQFDAPANSKEAATRTLSLIPEHHWERLEETIDDLRAVPGYKRTRERQVLELRFDGVAGCLRTPEGGSSRQWLVLKDGKKYTTRLLTIREVARLMGAPDDYELPGTYNDGYKAMGDAVVVPVVDYLATHLLQPLAERME